MTAAVYIRKSREEEGKQAHRLRAQREQLPAHARAQGWDPVVYDDGFASAARGKAELLPERKRLEADIRGGQVDVVLCIELSRLSRDDTLQDYVTFLALCSEHGVRLATPSRCLDPAQSSDWMLLILEGGFSSVEMRQIVARLKEGQDRAWEAGGHVGGAIIEPYRRGARPGEIIIDPDAKKRVLSILHSFVASGSVSAGERMRAFGYHKNTLRRWVSEKGLQWYIARRPSRARPGEWVRCQWEPILTEEEAEAVRQARESTRHRPHAPSMGGWLFSGLKLLRCGYCGCSVTSQSSGPKRYYLCWGGGWKSTCVHSRMVRQERLERGVVTHVLNTLGKPDELREIWRQLCPADDSGSAPLVARETELLSRKARLVEAVEVGALELAAVATRFRELTDDLAAVRSGIAALSAQQTPPSFDELAEIADTWEALSIADRKALLCAVLERIDVTRDNAVLHYAFPRNLSGDKTARIHLPLQRRNQQKTGLRVVSGGKKTAEGRQKDP